MRRSRVEAARTRDRVVDTASEMFRGGGYDGTGIASLMKAAGLTNGAFYKQFDSKEALIAEATAHALAENAASWQAVLDASEGDPFQEISNWYLSERHVVHRERGCAFATLACEAPRHGAEVRRAFQAGILRTLALLADATGPTAVGDDVAAIRHLCRLVGALMLARAVEDPAFAARIVAANREEA